MAIVTILMAARNAFHTIELSLSSLQTQTFQDWEAIVIDDASDDDTWKILHKWANTDRRIRIIRNLQRQGLAACLNLALREVSTELVARQDADDYSLPFRLEKQVKHMLSSEFKNTAVLGTWALLIDTKGVWGYLSTPLEPKIKDWVKGSCIIHPTTVIRTRALREVGGYDERLRRTEDYDLWLRMTAQGYLIRSIPDYLYAYRLSPDDYAKKNFRARIEEAGVRLRGYKLLRVKPWSYIYVIKPILLGLVPKSLLAYYHQAKYKGAEDESEERS